MSPKIAIIILLFVAVGGGFFVFYLLAADKAPDSSNPGGITFDNQVFDNQQAEKTTPDSEESEEDKKAESDLGQTPENLIKSTEAQIESLEKADLEDDGIVSQETVHQIAEIINSRAENQPETKSQ
jgi:hypothetical protein